MSENSEPIETEQRDDVSSSAAALADAPTLSHRRILAAMFALIVFGALVGFLSISLRFGFGVLSGGALSFVNYFWLKNSLRRVFKSDSISADGEPNGFSAIGFFLRYAAFGVLLATVFLTEIVPIISVLFGLASFAFAIMVEASILLFAAVFKK